MFTLRNVNTGQVVSREDVKCVIKTQLQGDIVAGEFDVGIVSSASVISIRSEADVKELWADIQMGKKTILWCDGLKEKPTESVTNVRRKKRKGSSDMELQLDENESDEDTSQTAKRPSVKKRKILQEEREERVQSTIEKLKEKHGAGFTPMQIRIWGELVAGDLHSSLDEPPKPSMFVRAGSGGSVGKKKNDSNSLTEAVTQAAVAISSVLSPRSNPPSTGTTCSPAKHDPNVINSYTI